MSGWFKQHIMADEQQPSTVELTDAFMRMDTALSQVGTAVDNYRAATGRTDVDVAWDRVRSLCAHALDYYMSLTSTDPESERVTVMTVEQCRQMLEAAVVKIDEFRGEYSDQLNAGVAAVEEITASMQRAQDAALRSRRACAVLDTHMRAYTSVRSAEQHLDCASARLTDVWKQHRYADMPAVTKAVVDCASQLETAVAGAPQLVDQTTAAISSVSSRLAAARTRLEGVKPALTALLREFAAASSTDLVDNEQKARNHIAQAVDCLGRARAALHNSSPEDALELTRAMREQLRHADRLIDAVPSRLRMLHELRENPESCSKKVRFELRDAQMLAVNRGSEKKYAPMLDNALERIERLEAGLTAVHPDYWAYANGLDKVNDFIQSVVAQIRG